MIQIQNIMSEPAKVPVMIKKGGNMVQLTRTTKSGDVKNVYKPNPEAKIIKQVRHWKV